MTFVAVGILSTARVAKVGVEVGVRSLVVF